AKRVRARRLVWLGRFEPVDDRTRGGRRVDAALLERTLVCSLPLAVPLDRVARVGHLHPANLRQSALGRERAKRACEQEQLPAGAEIRLRLSREHVRDAFARVTRISPLDAEGDELRPVLLVGLDTESPDAAGQAREDFPQQRLLLRRGTRDLD